MVKYSEEIHKYVTQMTYLHFAIVNVTRKAVHVVLRE